MMKFHRKTKQNEICLALDNRLNLDLGSKVHGQDHSKDRGQNVSVITYKLLKQIGRNFTEENA